MKNKNKFSLLLSASLFLGVQTYQAQVFTVAQGDNYFPGGVSDNGVVSIYLGKTIYKWDQTSGLVNIGTLTTGTFAGRVKVSNDGSKISSTHTNPANNLNEISLYNVNTQTWQNLGGIATTASDGALSSSWGISQDGSTIVGLGWLNNGTAKAVKWDATNGMQALQSLIPSRSSRANAISADKNTIVGWQDQLSGTRNGTKWVNGVQTFITDTAGDFVGEASDVSADGKTIVGKNNNLPYVWNEQTGFLAITHPNEDPFFGGGATAVSGDGKTVVGYFRATNGPSFTGEGFIWTPTGGRQNLNDYITSLGMNTQGITFGLPLAISSDGKKIVGTGTKSGNVVVAFMIDITAATLATSNNTNSQIVSIAPNPVKEFFKISEKNIDKAVIYDVTGQKINDLNIVDGRADVSYLAKGIYLLQVEVAGTKQNIKFIKE